MGSSRTVIQYKESHNCSFSLKIKCNFECMRLTETNDQRTRCEIKPDTVCFGPTRISDWNCSNTFPAANYYIARSITAKAAAGESCSFSSSLRKKQRKSQLSTAEIHNNEGEKYSQIRALISSFHGNFFFRVDNKTFPYILCLDANSPLSARQQTCLWSPGHDSKHSWRENQKMMKSKILEGFAFKIFG